MIRRKESAPCQPGQRRCVLPRVFSEQQQAAGLLARMLLAAPPEPARKWNAIRDAKKPDVAREGG